MIREIYNTKSQVTYNNTKPYNQVAKNTTKIAVQDSFIKASEPLLVPDVYTNVKIMDEAKAEKIFNKANDSSAPDYFGKMVTAAAAHYVKSAQIFEEALKNDSNPNVTNQILSDNNSAFAKIYAKFK